MRPVLRIAVAGFSFALASIGLHGGLQADELFSETRLDQVFAPPPQNAPAEADATQQPAAPQGTTLKKDELEAFIKAAGLDARKAADNVYALQMQKDQFKFTIGFTISPNDENVWIGILLSTVDESAISPRVLLGLLEANATHAPAHFVYSAEGKRIDLQIALRNINLQPQNLKQAVDNLVDVAVRTANLWSNPSGNGAPAVQPGQPAAPEQNPAQPPAAPQQTQPAPTQEVPAKVETAPAQPTETQPAKTEPALEPSKSEPVDQTNETETAEPAQTSAEQGLVGQWVAAPQKGVAFGIEFTNDGKFVLLHRNAKGQESRTEGSYTLNGDNLTLAGLQGKTLEGKIVRVNPNVFVFIPKSSGAKITFIREA